MRGASSFPFSRRAPRCPHERDGDARLNKLPPSHACASAVTHSHPLPPPPYYREGTTTVLSELTDGI